MVQVRATRLSEIASLAFPSNAPLTLRLSHSVERTFQAQRKLSYPGGHSKERGGTIVADSQGVLTIQNVGGLGSTNGTFSPNFSARDPTRFKVVGVFHTHPYDRTEGSYNGVSFSGADIAELILDHLTISVVQSGPRLFALVKTAQAPATVDYTKVNNDQIRLSNS